MSTAAIEQEEQQAEVETEAAIQTQTAVGDSDAAALIQGVSALKWFEIVEVEEVGFKAFCRIPNDYQHHDIREKAQAAKARRIRQLRHPETDANVILESELEAIAAWGADSAIPALVEELLLERINRDRDEAMFDLLEDEKWGTIRQDMERWRELNRLPVDDRPADEYKEVSEHIAEYAQALEKRIEEIQKPHREALTNLGLDGLIDKVREKRIDADSNRAFSDTFEFWQILAGTLKLPDDFDPASITSDTIPNERFFTDEKHLREYDALVVTRLQETFSGLESGLASLSSGNS